MNYFCQYKNDTCYYAAYDALYRKVFCTKIKTKDIKTKKLIISYMHTCHETKDIEKCTGDGKEVILKTDLIPTTIDEYVETFKTDTRTIEGAN